MVISAYGLEGNNGRWDSRKVLSSVGFLGYQLRPPRAVSFNW